MNSKDLAVLFHDTYERLAPSFGYETRPDTKAFNPESANGKLMIAVCEEILSQFPSQGLPENILQELGEKEVMIAAFAKIREMFRKREWIMEGRGSYRYDDDRYKEEVRYLFDEFDAIANETWKNIKTKTFEYREKIIAEHKASAPSQGLREATVNISTAQELIKKATYWKTRCEAAEKVVINETNDGYNQADYEKWYNLSIATEALKK